MRRMEILGALLGVIAVALAAAFPQGAGAASLVADYRFDDSLDSSVPGAPTLETTGPGNNPYATATIEGVPDRVLTFVAGNGLRFIPPPALVNGPSLLDRANYSVLVSFEFDALSSYQRILNFEPIALDSDDGLYSYDDYLAFYYMENGSDEFLGPPGTLTANAYADLAFTRAADKTVRAYIGEEEQIIFTDVFDQARIGSDGLRFFEDNNNDEEEAGSVARIRIYDGVLTPEEIATIRASGGLAARAKATGKPRLAPKQARKARKVKTGISVSCPAEAVPCPVKAKVKRAKRNRGVPKVLASLKTDLDPGADKKLTAKLTPKARRAIRRKGKLAVSVSASIVPSSGEAATAKNRGKL